MTQPAPTSGSVAGITINVPTPSGGSTAKKGDLYGLGDWGSQNVNPGDLPITLDALKLSANGAAGGTGGGTTGDQIVKAFASSSPDQIATIQHALLMGGYYSSTYTPRYGVISPEDVSAFAKAVRTAGQSGQAVSKILESSAQYGAAMGVAAAQQQTAGNAKTAVINLPNTQDLEAAAEKAFEQVVGHKPSPKQQAAFAALYRGMSAGMQRSANQAEYDATNPPVNGALASADPGALAQQAAGTVPHPYTYGGGSAGAAEHGQQVAAASPSFDQQIGGLMSLGQSVAAAQSVSAQPTGLTQISENSPVSPDVAAVNYARNADPHGAAANDTANVFDNFLSIISRSFG